MMTAAEGHRTSSWTACALLGVGVVAVGFAGWSIVDGGPGWAGVLLLVAAACLVFAAALPDGRSPRGTLMISMADRLFDGVALSAIAWAYRSADPATAAGALVALGSSFLSAYIQLRGASLGYDVEEALGTRVVCYGLVSIGLMMGWIDWTVWVLAAFVLLAAAVRASQVAKEERA
jgi:phosphatidylglycerophosphate synthase